jgi:hypothetical protein
MGNIFKKFNYDSFKDLSFPETGSPDFDNEIEVLNSLPFNKDYVIYNDDVINCFKDLFDKKNIKFPEKTVNKLVEDSVPIIKDLKNFYDRPRPWDFTDKKHLVKLDSMGTPSFPSGHSTQGELISDFLSHYYPELQSELDQISKDISLSRNIARAHYPTDSEVGIKLGKEMSKFLKQN